MASATYLIEVDWDNNGSFESDISADVISVDIDRGFSDIISRVANTGNCTIIVNNASKSYSPASQATRLPRRPIRVQMTFSATTVTLFRGFIDGIFPSAGIYRDRRAVIQCVDATALLQLHELNITLQENQRGDQLISTIVSDVYTPASTAYDTDVDIYPFAGDKWSDDLVYGKSRQRALKAIKDICASNWGWFYVGRDGSPVFENRHHRILDTTSIATFSNSMTGLKYSKEIGTVYNDVNVTAHPRDIGSASEILWSLDTSREPTLSPSQVVTYRARYRDPNQTGFDIGGACMITPASTTDYIFRTAASGLGTNITSELTIAASLRANNADLQLSNSGSSTGYLNLLQVRGNAVRVFAPPTLTSVSASSQTAYEKRTLSFNAVLQDDPDIAQDMADYLLSLYKDPADTISGIRFIANADNTAMGYARDLEISSRITITEMQTGLSSVACFVQAIHHHIQPFKLHTVTLEVEPAADISYWILGTSALNTTTILGF